MQDILKKYLVKQGVEDVTQLSAEEKATFKEWESTFNRELRAENVAAYLAGQINRLNKELREAVTTGQDRVALLVTARLENYEALAAFLREPGQQRSELESFILSKL